MVHAYIIREIKSVDMLFGKYLPKFKGIADSQGNE